MSLGVNEILISMSGITVNFPGIFFTPWKRVHTTTF